MAGLQVVQGQDKYLEESAEPIHMEDGAWEEIVEGRDYTELSDPEDTKEEEDDKGSDLEFDIDSLAWLKYPIIILLGLLVVYILVKTIIVKRNINLNKSKITIQELEEIEEDLAAADMESMLERALAQKEFRLAIRIRYLIILRDLDNLEWISFRKDKTNFYYILELGERPETQEFKVLTRIFESIWYSDQEFSEEELMRIRARFASYSSKLNSNVS